MSTVDNRVVQMEFDNKDFEQNATQSMDTLDKLNEKLNFDEANKNLDEFEKKANSFNLFGIGDAIDDLVDRFSFLGTFGGRIVENLADSFYNASTKFVQSLTTDQINAGMSKYTKNSEDTIAIMNMTGKSIEEVGEWTDKLSWYSDMTSFELGGMTQAMKLFAQGGMSGNEVIDTIMGIGNSITYAGVSAKDATEIFSLYAKSMKNGYMDRRTFDMLQMRNVMTTDIQQRLLDAAVEAKTLTKINETDYKTQQGLLVNLQNIQQTINDQKGKYVTTEVMQKVFGVDYGNYITQMYDYAEETGQLSLTYGELSDAFNEELKTLEGVDREMMEFGKKAADSATQAKTITEAIDAVKDAASSSFSRMFQSIFGNAEESIEVWSNFSTFLSDLFNSPIYSLESYISEWSDGGRDALLEGFRNIGTAINTVLEPIKLAFTDIFGTLDVAGYLKELTERFKDWTATLIPTEEKLADMRTVWGGVFTVVKGFGKALGTVVGVSKKVLKTLSPLKEVVWDIVVGISGFITKISDSISHSKGFQQVVEFLSSSFQKLLDIVSAAIVVFTGAANDSEAEASKTFTKWAGIFTSVKNFLTPIIDSIIGLFAKLRDKIKEKFNFDENLSFFENVAVKFEGIRDRLGPVMETIGGFFTKLWDTIKGMFDKNAISTDGSDSALALATAQVDTLGEKADTLGEKLDNAWQKLKNFISNFFGKNNADAEAAGAENESVFSTVSGVFDRFGDWIDTFLSQTSNILGVLDAGVGVMMGWNLNLLIKALKNLVNKISSGKLFGGLDKMFSSLSGLFTQIKKNAKWKTIAGILKDIAVTIGILTGCIALLALIKTDHLTEAAAAVVAVTEVVTVLATALMGIATKDIGKNSALGLGGIAGVMTALAAFMYIAVSSIGEVARLMDQNDANFDKAILAVAAVAAVGIGVSLGVAAITKIITVGDVLELIEIMGVIAVMMFASAKAVQIAAQIPDAANAIAGAEALSLVMLAMATTVAILGGAKMKGKLVKTLPSVIVLTKVLPKLAECITMLDGMEPKTILAASFALDGIMVGIGILVVAMSKADIGNDMMKAAASIGLLSLGIALIVPAILAMGLVLTANNGLKVAGAGLLGIVAVLVALGAAMRLFSKIAGEDGVAAANSMIKLGAGLALFGVGVVALGVALPLLTVGIGAFAVALVAAITGVIVALAALQPILVPALQTLCAGVAEVFETLLMFLIEIIGDGIIALGYVVLEALPDLLLILTYAVEVVLHWAFELIPGIVEYLGTAVLLLIERLCQFVLDNANWIVDIIVRTAVQLAVTALEIVVNSLVTLADTLWNAVAEAFGFKKSDVRSRLDPIWQDMHEEIDGFCDKVFDVDVEQKASKLDLVGAVGDALSDQQGKLKDEMDKQSGVRAGLLGGLLPNNKELSEEAKGDGMTYVKSFAQGKTDALGNMDLFSGFFDGTNAEEAGEAMGTDFTGGFETALEGYNYNDIFSGNILSSDGSGIFMSPNQKIEAEDAGEEVIDTFGSGIGTGFKNLNFGELFQNNIFSIFNSKENLDEAERSGANIIDGLIKGLNSRNRDLTTTTTQIARGINKTFANEEKIQSPSKVWSQFGSFLMEGLGLGIENGERDVNATVAGVASDMNESLKTPYERFIDLLNMDPSFHPTITPILDIAGIQNQANYMSALLSGHALNVPVVGYTQSPSLTNTDVVNELATLRRDVDDQKRNAVTSESLGHAVREALDGTGVYMDRTKVGKLVTTYQTNVSRANGV